MRLLERKRPASKAGRHDRDHRHNLDLTPFYQTPAFAATPGPILARHYFRGCELLAVTA